MRRLNIRRRYILTNASTVLVVIVLTSLVLLFTSTRAIIDTLTIEQTERGKLIYADIEAQFESFWQIRNSIKVNYLFQPIYQKKYYSRRLELIQAFDKYKQYLPYNADIFLLYRDNDLIFYNQTCFDWATLCRLYWGIEDSAALRSLVFDGMATNILRVPALQDDLLFVFPFEMNNGQARDTCCLFIRVAQRTIQERLHRISGLESSAYTVTYGDSLLLGDAPYKWRVIATGKENISVGLQGVSTDAYERFQTIYRIQLLFCGVFILLSITGAVLIALYQYRPIGFIHRRLGGEPNGQNELAYIERVTLDKVQENERIKRHISTQLQSLAKQSSIIEQQANKLRQQLVLLLLLGVYHDLQDMPAELVGLFPNPCFSVFNLPGVDAAWIEKIEKCAYSTMKLYAVSMFHQHRLVLLANHERGEARALKARLTALLGDNAMVGYAETDALSDVRATYVQVSGGSDRMDMEEANELLLSKESMEMFKALLIGDQDNVLARVDDFSEMLFRHPVSMIDLRKLSLVLLRQIQSMLSEHDRAVSEEHAAALMVSPSVDAFVDNLRACAMDLYEDAPPETRMAESLRLLNYIDEHACEEDMALAQLETVFGMCRKMITATIKKLTDMGFREYIIYQRIERAKLLLLNTKLSISVIAEKCGYMNSSYFIKSFKAVTKKTPKQFQRDNI